MSEGPNVSFDQLKDLAQRLLSHPYPEGPAAVEIRVGGFPQHVTVEIPSPDNGRLLGTALHTVQDRPALMTAVFEGGGTSAMAISSYETQLSKAGWSRFEGFGSPPGGFVPSGFMGIAHTYRQDEDGPILMVNAADSSNGQWEMRVRIDWHMPKHLPIQRHGVPDGADRIPPLFAPPGAFMQPQGGGGGGGTWNSYATVKTSMPVHEVESHFSEQLTNAGWVRAGGRSDETVAWSSWRLPGTGHWGGVLLVLRPFGGDDQRFLTLQIQSREPSTDGGWQSSVTSLGR